MIGTFWAVVPALIAIILALITKQVYVSLFLGIFVGAMFLASGNPLLALGKIYAAMSENLGLIPENLFNAKGDAVSGGSGPILIFLVMLGIMVVLITKAGGSRAYGNWASKKIKTRNGAMFATSALGALIFVDDYFNCLTVGSVMRPVTDKFKISRAKLAYIIDATAAPICIIAPVSSWAAAVSSTAKVDGFSLFCKTIPFNLYAILTIIMVICLSFTRMDFGKMYKNEYNALKNNDLFSGETDIASEDVDVKINEKGKVKDLVIPILVLIISCIGCMIYNGFYGLGTTLQSHNLIEAFGNCDAGISLATGSTIAVVFTAIFYITRKVMNFKEFTDSFVQGFKSMVPAILILALAWTLSSICGELGLDTYVKNVVGSSKASGFIPAAFFIIALLIAFATGTSWGTFGILIPIVYALFGDTASTITVISISATLAGAVCGDHISPISDTTILASAGAQVSHVDHVKTQLPYALFVASICFIGYIVAGYTKNIWLTWATVLPLFIIAYLVLYFIQKKRKKIFPKLKSEDLK